MKLNSPIQPFVRLGRRLSEQLHRGDMDPVIRAACQQNPWFTAEYVRFAIRAICQDMLEEEILTQWLRPYQEILWPEVSLVNSPAAMSGSLFPEHSVHNPICVDRLQPEGPDIRNIPMGSFPDKAPRYEHHRKHDSWPQIHGSAKRVGIIMAGNIPLVGFFDLMSVLVSGHKALIKPSSKDRVLMEYVISQIKQVEPNYQISEMGNELPDLLIGTGSDDTVRSLRIKYAGIPAVYRGSRTSYALLTGNESEAALQALADDIFTYFGMGCRSVSHLFIPKGYNIEKLIGILQVKPISHPGFLLNYRQNKALLTLQGIPFWDGGYFIMTEQPPAVHALSRISYQVYGDMNEVMGLIKSNRDQIQCLVAGGDEHADTERRFGMKDDVRSFPPSGNDSDSISGLPFVEFGQAQHPRPWDYADGIDMLRFLLNKQYKYNAL